VILKNFNFQSLKTVFAKTKAHIAEQCISAPFVRWTTTIGGKFNYELCQISGAAFWKMGIKNDFVLGFLVFPC